MKKEVTKALAFREGNWKMNKENVVTKEVFTMTEGEINFVEIIGNGKFISQKNSPWVCINNSRKLI